MVFMGVFGVRNDSSRGILIETLQTSSSSLSVYFFKYHDQPLSRHCEQVQSIVRRANVRRAKKIEIDMTQFIHEYWQNSTETVEFRGTKLNSMEQQIAKVHQTRITKEIGAAKRAVSIAVNKQAKTMEKERKILAQMEVDELKFQAERIRRINEMVSLQLEESIRTEMSGEEQHGNTHPPGNSGNMYSMD